MSYVHYLASLMNCHALAAELCFDPVIDFTGAVNEMLIGTYLGSGDTSGTLQARRWRKDRGSSRGETLDRRRPMEVPIARAVSYDGDVKVEVGGDCLGHRVIVRAKAEVRW